MAIESEIRKQIKAYESSGDKDPALVIDQATYRFDPERKTTILMRRKEEADDYRYFPEPDLVPIILTDEYIEEIKKQLPELPYERKRRYIQELALSEHTAFVLTSDKKFADYFEACLKHTPYARTLAN